MSTALPPINLDVWILAGQSNMEGCGLLREGLPPDERVWSFSPAGNWEIAQEPLHRHWESFTENHPIRLRTDNPSAEGASNAEMADIARQTQVTGAGLGIAFGIATAEKTGQPVGLIPCAHGGTSLADWNEDKKTTSDFYGGMLERVKRAGGNLRGILWYQGESETAPATAVGYGEKLSKWITTVRADLGHAQLPFYVVQLGRLIDPCPQPIAALGWETVREAIRLLPEYVPNCSVTSAIDLGLGDPIHLDSPSLIRLGRRLARLATGEKSPTVSRIVRDREEEQIRGGLGIVQLCCDEHGSTWKKLHPLSGFSLHDPTGGPPSDIFLIQAEVAINDPTALRLVLTKQPDDNLRIGYGLGLNPFCTVVDERDFPLMAFLPQKIDG